MRPSRILIYAALTLLSAFFLLPIYVLVLTSVNTFAEADLSRMWDLPNGISTSGLDTAWTALSPNFVNSIYLVIPATIFTFAWLATPFIVLPPMPPTPMLATCNMPLGAALFKMAGAANTTLAAAAVRPRKRRRLIRVFTFMAITFRF